MTSHSDIDDSEPVAWLVRKDGGFTHRWALWTSVELVPMVCFHGHGDEPAVTYLDGTAQTLTISQMGCRPYGDPLGATDCGAVISEWLKAHPPLGCTLPDYVSVSKVIPGLVSWKEHA